MVRHTEYHDIKLLTTVCVVLSWPRGAPRCDIKPGHGAQTPDNLNVAVNKMGSAEWKVSDFLALFLDKENKTT